MLQIKNLHKAYQETEIFRNFNLELQENTISCILGPSGCGKTTLLNIIGKLIDADQADLIGFENKKLSYIFQEPRLLPWKTVSENIEFILRDNKQLDNYKEVAKKYLKLVELENFAHYYPSRLSGGMKQRVAIARAFSYPSDIILMDEPLKALDLKLKLNLIRAFRQIWMMDKRTVFFVTHDIEEALLLGNDIYIFGQAPVNIQAKFSIDEKERDLNSSHLIDLKKQIWNVMK